MSFVALYINHSLGFFQRCSVYNLRASSQTGLAGVEYIIKHDLNSV